MNWHDPELPGGFQDADFEMRELYAAGARAARGRKAMMRLRAEGKLAEAAEACSHGRGYPTSSLAADDENDPRASQHGFRCSDCGSWFAGDGLELWDLRGRSADAPCEFFKR